MKTIYIKVPCSKNTPEPDGEFYFTSTGLAKIDEDGQWSDNIGYVVHPEWWLEEKEEQVVMDSSSLKLMIQTIDSISKTVSEQSSENPHLSFVNLEIEELKEMLCKS